jgi:hypothetical protein
LALTPIYRRIIDRYFAEAPPVTSRQLTNAASKVILAFSNLETGQPAFALLASS